MCFHLSMFWPWSVAVSTINCAQWRPFTLLWGRRLQWTLTTCGYRSLRAYISIKGGSPFCWSVSSGSCQQMPWHSEMGVHVAIYSQLLFGWHCPDKIVVFQCHIPVSLPRYETRHNPDTMHCTEDTDPLICPSFSVQILWCYLYTVFRLSHKNYHMFDI